MNTYEVKVTYTFDAVVHVRAESKREAVGIVESDFKGFEASIDETKWTSESPIESGIYGCDWDGLPSDVKIR
jgi:hypothetical protein